MTLLQEGSQYLSYKHHWSDQRKSILLVVGPVSLDQKDPGSFAFFIVRTFPTNIQCYGSAFVSMHIRIQHF
jgi:hypothetical protein